MKFTILKLSQFKIGVSIACTAVLSGSVFATVGIQGTMSNFDVFNETGLNAYGAELDLDGVHASEVFKTFPSHFSQMSVSEYSSGTSYGTKILFSGYNFTPGTPYLISRSGQSTNGHYCVNLPGCEHFGFSTRAQPTSTRYYWLDQSSNHLTSAPMSVPGPTWTYVPPAAPGLQGNMQAVVKPVPVPPIQQNPDAVWAKVYYIEVPRAVDLNELMSGPDTVAPQLPSEVEAEWTLLGGDVNLALEQPVVNEADFSVIRRFEYYQYTGGYDEVHLPTSAFTGGSPPANELGQFIAANMAAVVVPEPASGGMLLIGATGLLLKRRKARKVNS
jgi:hypothetical protein